MIYDIVISDQAEIDLRGIFEYIAFELQAPENASGQLDRLEACIMDMKKQGNQFLNYCTGEERFTFIKLPKCLVEDECFIELSLLRLKMILDSKKYGIVLSV